MVWSGIHESYLDPVEGTPADLERGWLLQFGYGLHQVPPVVHADVYLQIQRVSGETDQAGGFFAIRILTHFFSVTLCYVTITGA